MFYLKKYFNCYVLFKNLLFDYFVDFYKLKEMLFDWLGIFIIYKM